MKPEKMDDTQIEAIAREAITDALSFIESEVADDRIKAQALLKRMEKEKGK